MRITATISRHELEQRLREKTETYYRLWGSSRYDLRDEIRSEIEELQAEIQKVRGDE